LSGDISGDDITDNSRIVTDTDNLVGNNNYHVVYAIGVFSDTVLDGFSITSGKADGGTNFYKVGGGIFCNGTGINGNCSPTLENLNLSGNLAAEKGGGIYNNAAFSGTTSPNMTNVSFLYNKSLDKGGAIYNDGDQGSISLILEDVNFFNNSADNSGGAVYNFCDGGTISSDLKNIVIAGNSAAVAGGAIYNLNNNGAFSSTLKNIAFSGNSVNIAGGAIYNNGSISSTLSNITFSGNRADLAGGALYNNNAGNIEIRNTIVWNNLDKSRLGTVDANIQNSGNSTTTLKNSLVQGTGGSSSWISDTSYVNEGGNIDEDPLFIDPLSPSEAPTTAGNLRLQENSPAIDSGGNMYIVGVPFDLDGNKRIVDGNSHGSPTVDIGAFEFQINYKFGVYIPVTYH
jgi:predicted outer membrane repeat protein